jgi:hypothetical protein
MHKALKTKLAERPTDMPAPPKSKGKVILTHIQFPALEPELQKLDANRLKLQTQLVNHNVNSQITGTV